MYLVDSFILICFLVLAFRWYHQNNNTQNNNQSYMQRGAEIASFFHHDACKSAETMDPYDNVTVPNDFGIANKPVLSL